MKRYLILIPMVLLPACVASQKPTADALPEQFFSTNTPELKSKSWFDGPLGDKWFTQENASAHPTSAWILNANLKSIETQDGWIITGHVGIDNRDLEKIERIFVFVTAGRAKQDPKEAQILAVDSVNVSQVNDGEEIHRLPFGLQWVGKDKHFRQALYAMVITKEGDASLCSTGILTVAADQVDEFSESVVGRVQDLQLEKSNREANAQ